MKTISKFIIAAMAAISVFSSCQKELVNESANKTTDGIRVISVAFDNSTKATLNGLAPSFEDEDLIRVSDGIKSEVCTLSVSGGTTKFTTTLSGELTAIYPADAAVLSSNTADAPIAASNNFKVLATQTGKVEDAIIAKATVAEGKNTANFQGVTALFEITPPSTAKKITVTSLEKVESGSRTAGTAADINTEDTGKTVITVGDGSTDLPSTIYVALVPGVNLTDLSFDAGETVGMKGIPTSKITGGLVDATAANKKYTINNENWHPYVKIGGKKWATENIGATDSDPYGTYFMWGETTGLTSDKISSTNFPTAKYYNADNNSWSQSAGFVWKNCPWTNGEYKDSQKNVFTKYTSSNDYAKSGTADNKTKLDLSDDAAYANWGGAWRMPTGGAAANADFTTLAKAAKSDYASSSISLTSTTEVPASQGVYYYNVDGGKGLYFVDADGKKLFFPAAGYGGGTSLDNAGSSGYYWSSSLITDYPNYAYYLYFYSSNVFPQNYNSLGRYYGRSVRPVSD